MLERLHGELSGRDAAYADTAVDPCRSPDELVALMRAGDIQALDQITRCYGATLARVGQRYCRDAVQAEDAVQEALALAGEQLRTFRGDGSPEGWLVRIVMNTCRRMNRGRKNAPGLHDALEDIAPAAPGPSPEEVAQRAEVADRLGAALATLEPRDRAMVLMSEAEGWSAAEIADALDSTPGAVRTRLSRARAALREALGETWAPS